MNFIVLTCINGDNKQVLVPLDKIIYIDEADKFSQVYFTGGNWIEVKETVKEIAQLISSNGSYNLVHSQ